MLQESISVSEYGGVGGATVLHYGAYDLDANINSKSHAHTACGTGNLQIVQLIVESLVDEKVNGLSTVLVKITIAHVDRFGCWKSYQLWYALDLGDWVRHGNTIWLGLTTYPVAGVLK